jgi:hypothetical protein
MPLSPSFPDWLLKRDPTLAGALTNPLFLAFEARRQQRGSGRWVGFKSDPTAQLVVATPFLFVVGGLLFGQFSGIGLPCGCYFFIGVFAATILRKSLQKGTAEIEWVPPKLSNALGVVLYLPVLRDLWMTPNGGKDYAEALLLETRMRCHVSVGILACIPLGLLVLMLLIASNANGTGFILSAGDYVLIVVGAIFLLFSLRLFYWLVAVSHLSSVQETIKRAAGDRFIGATLAKDVLVIYGAITVLTSIVVLLALTYALTSGFWRRALMPTISAIDVKMRPYDSLRMVSDVIAEHATQLVWAVVFLALIPASQMLARFARRAYDKRLAETMTLADEKIPIFFDRILDR